MSINRSRVFLGGLAGGVAARDYRLGSRILEAELERRVRPRDCTSFPAARQLSYSNLFRKITVPSPLASTLISVRWQSSLDLMLNTGRSFTL